MADQLNTVLLVTGMALSVTLVCFVWFSRVRNYLSWAKVSSLLACFAALGWGGLGLSLPNLNLRVSPHAYYSLVHTKGLLGGMCLGFVLTILLARPYQKRVLTSNEHSAI
jgi:hypothetical protein